MSFYLLHSKHDIWFLISNPKLWYRIMSLIIPIIIHYAEIYSKNKNHVLGRNSKLFHHCHFDNGELFAVPITTPWHAEVRAFQLLDLRRARG